MHRPPHAPELTLAIRMRSAGLRRRELGAVSTRLADVACTSSSRSRSTASTARRRCAIRRAATARSCSRPAERSSARGLAARRRSRATCCGDATSTPTPVRGDARRDRRVVGRRSGRPPGGRRRADDGRTVARPVRRRRRQPAVPEPTRTSNGPPDAAATARSTRSRRPYTDTAWLFLARRPATSCVPADGSCSSSRSRSWRRATRARCATWSAPSLTGMWTVRRVAVRRERARVRAGARARRVRPVRRWSGRAVSRDRGRRPPAIVVERARPVRRPDGRAPASRRDVGRHRDRDRRFPRRSSTGCAPRSRRRAATATLPVADHERPDRRRRASRGASARRGSPGATLQHPRVDLDRAQRDRSRAVGFDAAARAEGRGRDADEGDRGRGRRRRHVGPVDAGDRGARRATRTSGAIAARADSRRRERVGDASTYAGAALAPDAIKLSAAPGARRPAAAGRAPRGQRRRRRARGGPAIARRRPRR